MPLCAVVIMLPAFFINIVQNVLVVLQLVVKWLFTAVLIYIFRWVKKLMLRRSDCATGH